MNISLRELVEIARALAARSGELDQLPSEATSETLLLEFERYSAALDAWDSGRGEGDETLSVSEKDLLRELTETLHPTITAMARKMKDHTSTALSTLRKRGKGLMAYADQAPKRISVRRPRKG